jgi:hypothetical protein
LLLVQPRAGWYGATPRQSGGDDPNIIETSGYHSRERCVGNFKFGISQQQINFQCQEQLVPAIFDFQFITVFDFGENLE